MRFSFHSFAECILFLYGFPYGFFPLHVFPADLSGHDESALMQEWFQLVHEKNGLSRYEQELMVRARELELEDRHARLQQQLKDQLSVDGQCSFTAVDLNQSRGDRPLQATVHELNRSHSLRNLGTD